MLPKPPKGRPPIVRCSRPAFTRHGGSGRGTPLLAYCAAPLSRAVLERGALHPLVHAHPVTGRTALYLDSTTTDGIEGMDEASGSALLDEIYEFATRPEFVYRHHWQVGDALLWDNGFTMHRREPFDPSARRLMKRTTIFLSRERHIVPEGSLVAA